MTKPTSVQKIGADALLLITSFFWGITFVIVKEAIGKVSVFFFLSQRFMLASAVMILICLLARRSFTPAALYRGIVLGILLFGGFAFQTLALLYTTASNTAFLTGINVVFVPIIGAVIFRQVITRTMTLGVVFASVGLFFLCTNGNWVLNRGDILGFLCALSVAFHVVFTGEFARRSDVYWLTAVQIGTIGVLSSTIATVQGYDVLEWHPEILWALIICALFATVFAFLVQTSMQRFTSPTHTALIFCMEPVFGAFFAYLLLGERLGVWGMIGAVMILTGMILSEISFPGRFIWKRGGNDAGERQG